jgi:hypothetical protein
MEPYHARGDPIRLQFSPTFATGGLAVEFPKVLPGGMGSMFFWDVMGTRLQFQFPGLSRCADPMNCEPFE